jgi:hypothetical protein
MGGSYQNGSEREIVREVVDSIHLAQNRDQWRALVNTVMKLRDPQKEGESDC